MVNKYWNNFIDDSDIGVRGVGPSLAEAFEQAAIALTAPATDPDHVEPKDPVSITCEAADVKTLFLAWLNALIKESVARKMFFSRFDVQLDGLRLRAVAWGERVDSTKHEVGLEPNEATNNDLLVEQGSDGKWLAQCVVGFKEPLVRAA